MNISETKLKTLISGVVASFSELYTDPKGAGNIDYKKAYEIAAGKLEILEMAFPIPVIIRYISMYRNELYQLYCLTKRAA